MNQTVSLVGLEVPDFVLPSTANAEFRLSAQRGSVCVIYFYPKDNTPGCTTEAGQFRDLHAEFVRRGCRVFGISRDSIRSHAGFKAKLGLPFELLSDENESACRLFGVIRVKKLYGREVQGMERSTFLIDAAGVVRREWRGLQADGHAAEVLKAAAEL